MVLLDGNASVLAKSDVRNLCKQDIKRDFRNEVSGLPCSFCMMISGRWALRPSSPMSTDSNMSPAITHRRPRRHKQNQCGEQENQPSDVFNDGTENILKRG